MHGDERDFREFAAGCLPRMRRFAFLLCGDPHTADDLVSTALGKLFRRWRKIDEIGQPEAYLRRMLVNAWIDERRRPWRRESPVPEISISSTVDQPELGDRLALMQLLARLPARRRAVLVLRFFEDLSVEQTAAILGCTEGTVKAHTSRGLADLRSLIGDAGFTTRPVS